METEFKISKGLKYPVGQQYCSGDSFYSINFSTENEALIPWLTERREEAKELVYGWLQEDAARYKDFLKQRDLPDHRISIIGGAKYPHVTNIITPEKPLIPNIDEHAAIGTAMHDYLNQIIDGKEPVLNFSDQANIKLDPIELAKGVLEQLADNDIRPEQHSLKVKNDTYIYCGEADALTDEGVLIDFKKTKTLTNQLKEKYFTQIAAYAYCLEQPISAMAIVTPYDTVLEGDVQKYFNKFLMLRGAYKERFGL